MQSSVYKFTILLVLIIVNLVYSQSNFKTWTETTVQDFSDNQLNNLIVKNDSGGEVQLPHPLVKTVDDYNDNSLYRFMAKDSAGNFVRTWIQGGNVYVKKYAADGSEITNTIRVNEDEGSVGENKSHIAILTDGTYIVVWTKSGLNYEEMNMEGQIYINDSVKSGSNFKINDTTNYSNHDAIPMANNHEHNFYLFYPLKVASGYKIHVQKRDINGNKVSKSNLLNPENLMVYELSVAAIEDETGYWVTWAGANGPSSWDEDIYLCHFNFNGVATCDAILVNDNVEKGQMSQDLCLDKNSNLFIVWLDERDAVEPYSTWQFNIYGQVFSPEGIKIGNNIRINSFGINSENLEPEVEFVNNEYQVSWIYWDQTTNIQYTYINKWKLDPKLSGQMVSSIFDGSSYGCNFKEISWDDIDNSNSNLKFQLRSANTIQQLNNSQWFGPSGQTDFYTINTGTKINSIHDGNRYLQYKVFFTSIDGNTSVLKSVSIKYISNDTLPPHSPTNLTAINSHASVTLKWDKNKENDLYGYKIYRGTQKGKYDKDWNVNVLKNLQTFEDTSALVGIKYYYSVTASDSSNNESGFSNEVSGVPFGINIYVNVNGSLSGDGSVDNPVKTIQHGIDLALRGDTVRVAPGEYNDSIKAKYMVSLIGAGAEQCIINSHLNAPDNCIIKGFTLTKSLECNSTSPIITENIFRGTRQSNNTAIQINNSSSPQITKNFISECAVGILTNNKCNPIIRNNIIKADDEGITILYEDRATIINNTITVINQYANPIQLLAMDTVKIENNILIGGINIGTTPVSEINYNDIWKPRNSYVQIPSTNISVDPGFVNEDLQDYHLSSTSLCVDAGDPDPIYNDVNWTRNDIGAYGGPDPFKSVLSFQLTKSISVSSLSGYPRDTISVYIGLDNVAGLAKADFIFAYDNTLLDFLSAELTEATTNFHIVQQFISTNGIKFSLTSNSGAIGNSNHILKLNFIVKAQAKTNDASPLSLKDINLFDNNLKTISLRSITNGAFIVNNTAVSENYIYVDSKYFGNTDGSRAHPFNTIMEAVNSAKEGDTVLVSGGDYQGPIYMKEGVSLIGSGASVTNIFVSGNQGILFDNINNAEISGFNIKADKNSTLVSSFIYCGSSSPVIKENKFESESFLHDAIWCFDSSNTIIINNYFNQMGISIDNSDPVIKNNFIDCGDASDGIMCSGYSNPDITGNKIIGSPGSFAVRINQSTAIIKNNFIYCNEFGYGIWLENVRNTKVLNNIIKDKGNSVAGLKILNSQNVDVVNNTFVTKGKGIDDATSTTKIINNIVVNNNNCGIEFSDNSQMDYNAFWNNSTDYSGINPGVHIIKGDVLFVDASEENYRLLPGSPCIDAGNPDSKFNDIDGSRNDIGAYGGPYVDSSTINPDGTSLAINQVTEKDTFQILITGENLKGLTEINLGLSYDPSILTMTNANSSSLTKCFSVEKINQQSGSTSLCLKSTRGIAGENGGIIDLQFVSHSSKITTATLHFDSASARDATTCLKNILNLKDGQLKIVTGIGSVDNKLPKAYSLSQNYPNPFNPSTTIRYELPVASKVIIKIYDILGSEVATLLNSTRNAGRYEVVWNASTCASGVYFYTIKAIPNSSSGKEFYMAKKLLLLK